MCWFNYENLASLKYRFLAITGKGKVKVRKLAAFETQPTTGLKPKIGEIEVDDFK
jgi:hypothetical protein